MRFFVILIFVLEREKFKKRILDFYEQKGRNQLPWRKNISSYRVLVSEIMLQQTQVERVIPFFEKWMKELPNIEKLAMAKQSDLLRLWKGLGYNSRALRLQKCAQTIIHDHNGIIPQDYKKLLDLPGIGPYTAGALMNFAFNIWTPFVDTNMRRVFIYHFFFDQEKVSDREILVKMQEVGYARDARTWAYALMDYGAHLGKILKKNPNRKSKHYSKQSKFIGSERQIRGKILEILLIQKKHKISEEKLLNLLREDGVWALFREAQASSKKRPEQSLKKILSKMEAEGFLVREKKSITLR